MDVVVFRVGLQQFGLPVTQVGQVFPLAEITPLAGAPDSIRGVVNIQGTVTAVVDVGRRLANSSTDLRLEQRLILVYAPSRQLALLADDVDGIRHIPDDAIADMDALLPGAGVLKAIAASDDGLIFIHDVELLLLTSEDMFLASALRDT